MENFESFAKQNNLWEKYSEAETLFKETSQTDPENEPFRSKYSSRKILSELKQLVADFGETNSSTEVICVSAAIDFCLGQYIY